MYQALCGCNRPLAEGVSFKTLDLVAITSGPGSRKPGLIHPEREASLDDVPSRLVDSHVSVVVFHTVEVLSNQYWGSKQQIEDLAGHLCVAS